MPCPREQAEVGMGITDWARSTFWDVRNVKDEKSLTTEGE